MNPIHLPFKNRAFKIIEKVDKKWIWDSIRKKYLVITPEEMVRQHIIAVLVEDFQIPRAVIALEKMVIVGKLKKRFDIVVYDSNTAPWLLIECKAPNVSLSDDTIMQALSYIQPLQAPHFMISNGSYTFLASLDKTSASIHWLDHMPKYEKASL